MAKKSAKDLAFDTERAKYKSQIKSLEYQIKQKENQISAVIDDAFEKDKQIIELRDWIDRLLEYMDLSKEDFQAMLDRQKELAELSSIPYGIFGVCGFYETFLKGGMR